MPWWDEDQTPQLLQKPQESFGPDGDYSGPEGAALYKQRLDAYSAQQAALAAAMPKLKSKEEFMATIKPGMLDEQGRFKSPNFGVNYMLEGLTPDQVYATASKDQSEGKWYWDDMSAAAKYMASNSSIHQGNLMLDAGWREGPDNGGGFFGGLTRSVGNLVKGIAENPAIMAAITAGVAPALSSGVQSATGWSAGTSKAVSSGIINGAKTLANGGNLTDMAKSAVLSAAGGVAGNAVGVEVKDFTGSPIAAKIASDLTNTAVKGGDLASTLVTSGTGLAVNEITSNIDGFDKLSELQKGIINSAISSAIRGKKITPGLIADIMTKTQQTVKKAKA